MRLLGSQADPPRGAGDEWLTTRIKALNHLGAAYQSIAMIEALPHSMITEPLALMRVQLLLGRGKPSSACEASEKYAENEKFEAAQWQWLHIFCKAALGDMPKAELMLSVLDEQGKSPPRWFTELIDSFKYEATRISELETPPDDFALSLLLYAGEEHLPEQSIDRGMIAQLPGSAKLQLARSEKYGDTQRILAMEHAVAYGAAAPEELVALYFAAKPEKLPSYAELEAGTNSPLTRAHAIQLLDITKPANAKAQLITLLHRQLAVTPVAKAALEAALVTPLTELAGRLSRDKELLTLAPYATATLMKQRKFDVALYWLRYMEREQPDALSTHIAAIAYDMLKSSDTISRLPPLPESVNLTQDDAATFLRLLALAEGMEASVPPALRQRARYISPPARTVRSPSPILMGEFHSAAEAGRKGEAILRAALILGSEHWQQIDDANLAILVEHLLQLGERKLAVSIAAESLLAPLQD